MKRRILEILSITLIVALLSSCVNGNNGTVGGETDVNSPEGNYLCAVPFYEYNLLCLETEDGCTDQQILELFDQIPSYDISKRLYTGEELGCKDSFKVIKDSQYLYLKLFYENTPGYSESKNKQHVILLREAGSDGPIYSVDVTYYEDWVIYLNLRNASRKTCENVITQVNEADAGYDALVKIPLNELQMDVNKLQLNILRIDWGANPITTYFPVENSHFYDFSNDAISLILFLGNQGRFADMKYTKSASDYELKKPEIKLDCVGVNRQQITIDGKKSDYQLSWQSPQGNITYPTVSQKRVKGCDVLTFDHPPVSEEGIYRIQLGDKNDSVLYVEKRSVIKSANRNIAIEEVEKKDVDISTVSDRGKLILDIVPPYAGIENIPDPKDTTLRPYGLFTYNISNPYHVKSNKTGDLYPDTLFPETEIIQFDNGNGKIIEYPFYKDKDGVICYFTPAVWASQKKYTCLVLPDLAKTDPAGAAKVLAKLCENYVNYAPALDYYFTNYPVSKAAGPPYPYYGGLWTRWFYNDLNLVADIAEAYAEVNKTNAFEKLSAETGRNIENEILCLIEDGIDFSFSYGIQDSNMDYAQWEGLIRIGKAIQRPDYIHYALERIDTFIKNNYLFDGFWREVTLSYHKQITSGLYKVLSLITKYSDPEGYIYPGTGERIENFKFLDRYPMLRKSYAIPSMLSYPNGRYLPVQDTHPSDNGTPGNDSFSDVLMSASGIAKLTGNTNVLKNIQTHAVLLFVPKYGHEHFDALNMNLFAYGVELLPDLGYTHTNNRYWTSSTLAHNTVTVNRRNSQSKDTGNILRYVPSEDSVGVMRACDQSAYREAETYDREVVYVPTNKNGPEGYVLDIFRVQGGNCHEYSLNLCADYDYKITTDVKWQKESETMLPDGVSYTKPTSESSDGYASGYYPAYMFVQDVQSAELANQPFKISCVTTESINAGAGLNILGTDSSGELLLGKAPSMRATRKNVANDLNDQCDDYQMDKMVLRKEGENLSSTFVTLMEPFAERFPAKVTKVERLSIGGLKEFDVVIKVTSNDFTDYIFSAYQEDINVTTDNIRFKGQFGFVRIQDGKAVFMQGIGIEELQYDGSSVPTDLSVSGRITDVLVKSEGDDRNGFVTDTIPDRALKGKYIIVRHPDNTTSGYKIKDIVEKEGITIVDIGDAEPGFVFDGEQSTKMLYYPHKQRKGVTEFYIDDVCIYSAD